MRTFKPCEILRKVFLLNLLKDPTMAAPRQPPTRIPQRRHSCSKARAAKMAPLQIASHHPCRMFFRLRK